MTSNTTAEVTASFVCKDIPIKVGDIERNITVEEKNTSNNTEGNSTRNNTANSTQNSNTTAIPNTNTNNNTTRSNTTNYITEMGDPNKSNLTSINDYVGR